jgi:predicted extracellular nuclease
MSPRSHHIPKIANHIADYLNSPDILFLQEISDDSGASDNGVVSANKTLTALVKAIVHAGGAAYNFVNIPPIDNMDGGKPGNNIRVAYL